MNECLMLCSYTDIGVTFVTPMVVINEGLPSGVAEVCYMGNATSDRPYEVSFRLSPIGRNRATCK